VSGYAPTTTEEEGMAVAFIQEFPIQGADRTTTNYDAVADRIGRDAPAGAILHTAGWDEEAGVFRIFDVWESRADAERFIKGTLEPVVVELLAGRDDAPPPAREYFYELHNVITR
jgi:hypothetical protein